ncbi:MAG: hypothetical protein V1871_07710 [Planctomycetota bacterium]
MADNDRRESRRGDQHKKETHTLGMITAIIAIVIAIILIFAIKKDWGCHNQSKPPIDGRTNSK